MATKTGTPTLRVRATVARLPHKQDKLVRLQHALRLLRLDGRTPAVVAQPVKPEKRVRLSQQSTMRLTDLRPEWRENPTGNRYLFLDCPTCPRGTCAIRIPVDNTIFKQDTWTSDGNRGFDTLTIAPSLQHHCATSPHFFIRNGNIEMV